MASLLRYVEGTWQVVGTVPAYDNGLGDNPDAILPIASVESLLSTAGVTAQTLAGFTSRVNDTEYKGASEWYSARMNYFVVGPPTVALTNQNTAVAAEILAVLEATVAGDVVVLRVQLAEGPPPTPFWTALNRTTEIV
jgi:hypothetical protein